MPRPSILEIGNVLIDALQRNPEAKLADLQEEVAKLDDELATVSTMGAKLRWRICFGKCQ